MTDHSISPRTGKPKQKQLGKSKLLLRERGRKIAVSLLKGKTQQEALIDAGYSPASARNASEILDNPVIREGYCEVLEQAGLTDVFAAKRIRISWKRQQQPRPVSIQIIWPGQGLSICTTRLGAGISKEKRSAVRMEPQ